MNQTADSLHRWGYPVGALFDSEDDAPTIGRMPLLTTREVMERTGWPRQWVNDLLHRGKLKGKQLPNGRWLIDEQSLNDYDPQADKGGRPPKKRKKQHDNEGEDQVK